ncbi:hypothetical protein K8O96_00845 [Clostridium sporogenes]|nr:hypothetical protein [Clostridium sporogenes]UAL59962.1 hypothetical protein K8O96_00845 [Clostridium sporogenes]
MYSNNANYGLAVSDGILVKKKKAKDIRKLYKYFENRKLLRIFKVQS